MSTYTTATEDAATLRAFLKKTYGWTSRDVSIRADNYSMGSALRIRIKSPLVRISDVKAASEKHEHIRRDGWGEILNGGNRYVDVSYTSEALEALGAPYELVVKVAADSVAPDSQALAPIAGTPFMVGRPVCRGWAISLWGPNSHIREFNDGEWGVKAMASHVGILLAEGKVA